MKGYYNPTPYQSPPGQSPFPFATNFFPVQIGPDASGVFAWTLYGLAVIRPDGRAVVCREGALLDVSAFVLQAGAPGTAGVPYCAPDVFRIPVGEVEPGDTVVVSDCPLSIFHVQERTPDGFVGWEMLTGVHQRYTAPLNPFFNCYVRVQSVFSMLSVGMEEPHKREGEYPERFRSMLPLLLLCGQTQGLSSFFMSLLFFELLGRRP